VIEKSGGGGSTVSVAVVLWLRLPLVPVMVRVEFPTGVVELVWIVRVDVPAPAIGFGLKVAVVPAGNPAMVRFTLPEKPFTAVVVTL